MKLTRHRGHGGGWQAVDVERPHLVDLRGREGHAGREVTSVAGCHDGCLLLHELKKRDTGRWAEGPEEAVGGRDGAAWTVRVCVKVRSGGWGGERGEGRTDSNGKNSELGEESNKRRAGEGWRKRREERQRMEGASEGGGEGRMHGEVDGWMAHGKHRESRAE